MYRSVAVPLDGTPKAETAVDWGVAVASRSNASLHLLLMARDEAGLTRGRRTGVPAGYLEDVAARVSARAGIHVRALVVRGTAGVEERLAAYLRGHRTDLVVASPSLCGRESLACLGRFLPTPVLVVPEQGPDGDRIRRMLVPLADMNAAEGILPAVSPLAELLSGRVTLLTILAPSYVIGASRSRGAAVDCSVSPKRRAAQSRLDEAAQALRLQGRTVTTRVLVRARPAPAIADFVISERIGVLAMSGAGRGKWNVMPEILRLLAEVPVAILTCGSPEWRVSPGRRPAGV